MPTLHRVEGKNTEWPVIDHIRSNGITRDVIIASFDPQKVRRCKELAPDLIGFILSGRTDLDFVTLARKAKADCIHFYWNKHPAPHALLTDKLLKECRDAGLKIIISNEERLTEIREIIKLDIYGIYSNLPDLLVEASKLT